MVNNIQGTSICCFRYNFCETACASVGLFEIGPKSHCATVVLFQISPYWPVLKSWNFCKNLCATVMLLKFGAIKAGGRPTRLLPHVKMLLIPIELYRLTVVIVFCSAGFPLWCKRIFFDLFWGVKLFYYGWIRVPIFSKVPSGSDLIDFL